MSRFLQLHILTHYPPSNLNRDDLNRPKTAFMGGEQRLRVSSQSLKRAWRTSELFQEALKGHIGTRTKEMGRQVYKRLLAGGVTEKKATAWARQIAGVFGKIKGKKDPLDIKQMAHFTPQEQEAVLALADRLASEGRPPSQEELQLLRRNETAVDIALFGRMLAAAPRYNSEAAAQVAHAVTVNRVVVEEDFFTAVDDLNPGEEDVGAGHMGELEFGSGTFYLYLCCDCRLLSDNLGGDRELAGRALGALAEAAATVGPTGKQNSFASRAYASYILAERGQRQPRSLAWSFVPAVNDRDQVGAAVEALRRTRDKMDQVYGPLAEARQEMDAVAGEGSLAEVIEFCREACS